MTSRELLQNFISLYHKPFTVEVAANLIDINQAEVKSLLPEFLKAGEIKRISETEEIFVRGHRYNQKLGTPHYRNWVFNITDANQLLNIIEQNRYSGIRPIAQTIGKSRQWVYIYLEALASIGVVDYRNSRYVVINRKQLYKIGTKVQKGILGTLRSLNRIGLVRVLV
jgi:predicted transcriptional regulator